MPDVSPRRADSAIALRLAGATYDEIATALEYANAEGARLAVERALASTVSDADRAELRELAVRRYERLLRGVWNKAISPTVLSADGQRQVINDEHLAAAREARQIIDRIVAVEGAAAPAELIITSPALSELNAWIAQVAPVPMPAVPEVDVFGALDNIEDADVVDDEDGR